MILYSKHQWKIQPLSGYTIDIAFHKLNIFYSQQCEVAGLTLKKITDCHHEEFYCGFLPSWNESCPCWSVYITLAIHSTMRTAEFDLFYQISKKKYLTVFLNVHLVLNQMSVISSNWDCIIRQIKQMSVYIYAEHGTVIQVTGKLFTSGM